MVTSLNQSYDSQVSKRRIDYHMVAEQIQQDPSLLARNLTKQKSSDSFLDSLLSKKFSWKKKLIVANPQ